jgi:DNA helicase-2/ATP-dependent DNA helicase PcrA
MFEPRISQKPVVSYRGGKMGVSAVPGSGKTTTLSMLAVQLIKNGKIKEDEEILIVTLVNSAVDNFNARIQEMLREARQIPGMGYRVRTLHGLANDIVRQKPALVGLSNNYDVADEYSQKSLRDAAVNKWLRLHPDVIQDLTSELHSLNNSKVRNGWHDLVENIAIAFIRQAKDLRVEPAVIEERMRALGWQNELLQMGLEIYTDYQQGLAYRGAVDFDDLIGMALHILNSDPDYLQELQARWPYILEDEAQDSSRMQEEILRKLSGLNGNWVRVGDPNQAIYETFTTANPDFLIQFMQEEGVTPCNLPESGRSTASIINLANNLIKWTGSSHPNVLLRHSLREPLIQITDPNDPHPNPPDDPAGITLYLNKQTSKEELALVVKSVKNWLPKHPDETVAMLIPSNYYGEQLVEELKKNNVPHHELLRSTDSTRKIVNLFIHILQHLATPARASTLAEAYSFITRFKNHDESLSLIETEIVHLLKGIKRPEIFLWPTSLQSWKDAFPDNLENQEVCQKLINFQNLLQRWHNACLLPIDQLILIITMDLFTEMSDLALAYKIAQTLEHVSSDNPEFSLSDFITVLIPIAQNKEKFIGFSDKDIGFDPDQYKGQVIVSTYHKAKGLEWDRVYLLSVNNFDFPSGDAQDGYVSEKYFVKDQLNLEAETLAQMNQLLGITDQDNNDELTPTQKARLATASERLRVLFVGITRAKKEVILTWNTGSRGDCQPAQALLALDAITRQEHK